MTLEHANEVIAKTAAMLAEERRRAEAQFERTLREYMLDNRRGGVCNLLAIIADLCEQQSEAPTDDWHRAYVEIEACSATCDLEYKT